MTPNEQIGRNYNNFCKSKECPEYIEWSFEYGNCLSCKKVGQSYIIDQYPDDCIFKSEIEKL